MDPTAVLPFAANLTQVATTALTLAGTFLTAWFTYRAATKRTNLDVAAAVDAKIKLLMDQWDKERIRLDAKVQHIEAENDALRRRVRELEDEVSVLRRFLRQNGIDPPGGKS